MKPEKSRIRSAWLGRVSGCMLGKPLELLSMFRGRAAVVEYLKSKDAMPLRDFVPPGDDPLVMMFGKNTCKGNISRAEPDDDVNYTVLALMSLEKFGRDLTTSSVAWSWLRYLPAGVTFTAERAAYRVLLEIVNDTSYMGLPPDLDLSRCASNPFSEWIGAQIRADMYGWVCPGNPSLAAELARRDASLSHTGSGVDGAVFVAALGASIPAENKFDCAIDSALEFIPHNGAAADAVRFARTLVGGKDPVVKIHDKFKNLSPVHTINNLAIVVWALLEGEDDFSKAIGDAVSAGLDTDCNGATVGGLWGLSGKAIPEHWTRPWRGKIAVELGGVGELDVEVLVERTVAVAEKLERPA